MNRRRHRYALLVFALFLMLVGCAGPATTGEEAATDGEAGAAAELVVFTAASLTEAFTELGARFEDEHPGTTVTFNFAGSQQLARQLGQGAPADVFASANQNQMGVAIEAGRIAEDAPQSFVNNRLVLIYPRDNPAGIETLAQLAQPGLKLVLAAEAVPVGQYALEFLDRAVADGSFGATFKEEVLGNVVSYEESVRAVLSKVVLGEADAGIVYSSDVTPESADRVGRIEIPDDLNTIATYPIAVVEDSPNAEQAQLFVASVLSAEGQKILAQHGFVPVTR